MIMLLRVYITTCFFLLLLTLISSTSPNQKDFKRNAEIQDQKILHRNKRVFYNFPKRTGITMLIYLFMSLENLSAIRGRFIILYDITLKLPTPTGGKSRRSTRSIAYSQKDRHTVYTQMEKILSTSGMDGKACMLRAICEMHEMEMAEQGLVGEIMAMILRASTSHNDGECKVRKQYQKYIDAEKYGKQQGNCMPYKQNCEFSIFEMPLANS